MLVKIKAYPGSSKERVVQKKSDTFEVHVKEKAKGGSANHAIIELLASFLGIVPSRLHIKKGARTRSKIIEIREFSGENL